MEKQMLRCDICGGTLKIQANREAVCESCGMAYSVKSLREKFDGLKVSVTGSRNDVTQWKELVNTYLGRYDYLSAESVVKKILEAEPSDDFANSLYAQLQGWKYCEVVNGRLISYSGKQTELILPTGITEICDRAFGRNADITRVVIPNGVLRIGEEAFTWTKLTNIVLPESVIEIGKGAFSHCLQLKSVILPLKLEEIGYEAFASCVSLETIDMPESIKELGGFAFSDCIQLKGTLTFPSIETIGDGVFCGCRSLKKIILGNNLKQVGQTFPCLQKKEWKSYDKGMNKKESVKSNPIDDQEEDVLTVVESLKEYLSKCVEIVEKLKTINYFLSID